MSSKETIEDIKLLEQLDQEYWTDEEEIIDIIEKMLYCFSKPRS